MLYFAMVEDLTKDGIRCMYCSDRTNLCFPFIVGILLALICILLFS